MGKQRVKQWAQHTALCNAHVQNKGRGHVIAQPSRLRSVSKKVEHLAAHKRAGTQSLELDDQHSGYECIKGRS